MAKNNNGRDIFFRIGRERVGCNENVRFRTNTTGSNFKGVCQCSGDHQLFQLIKGVCFVLAQINMLELNRYFQACYAGK